MPRYALDFDELRPLQAPAVVAGIVALILAGPDQVLDLYIALAQDLVPFPGLRSIFADEFSSKAAVGLSFGFTAVVLLCLSLWVAINTLSDRLSKVETSSNSHVHTILLATIAASPLVALGVGLIRSSRSTGTSKFSVGVSDVLSGLKLPEPLAANLLANIASTPRAVWFAGVLSIGVAVLLAIGIYLVERLWPNSKSTRSIGSASAVGAAIVFALATVAAVLCPIWIWAWLGAVFTLCLFFVCAVILGARLHRASRRIGVPIMSGLLVYAAALAGFAINDNHGIQTVSSANSVLPSKSNDPPELSQKFREWIESRSDWNQFADKEIPYPIYVVAAQGGGMYAAYHTAAVLSNLQDLCPAFATHLFAISAVSGGSVGAATFRAVMTPARAKAVPCADRERWPLSDDSATVLAGDYLSPLVAYLFFPDLLQRFLPFELPSLDRARALERSLISGVSKVGGLQSNFVEEPYLNHWTPAGVGPALIFNTTEVSSGRRRLISPFQFEATHARFLPLWSPGSESLNPSVAASAIISARFPWLTPSAWFRETIKGLDDSQPTVAKVRLVDGAYFEGSGITTAHDIVRALDAEVERLGLVGRVRVYLLALTSPDTVSVGEKVDPLGEATDPIWTMLNTRDARAHAALARAEKELGSYQDKGGRLESRVRKFSLEPLGLPLPLGWRLSGRARIMIDLQVGDRKRCQAKLATSEVSFSADCLTQEIYEELGRANQ
jgi:hypothetical protein